MLQKYIPDIYWLTVFGPAYVKMLGIHMSANLPLNEMSLEEKLQAMEALWEDLSREPNHIQSPSWHEDVLKETERRVESGETTFSDWEKAKVSVRDRLK